MTISIILLPLAFIWVGRSTSTSGTSKVLLPQVPQKYFDLENLNPYVTSGNDDVMRGKQGKGGVHVVKTNQVNKLSFYQ